MNYFEILGISFGLIALLKPVYMHIIPWDEMKGIEKAYSRKRPAWIVPVAIAGLILVAFTWYKELTTEYAYSKVVTLLFSLTAIKAIFFLFDYQKFQKWVEGMLQKQKGRKILLVDVGAGIFGLLLIVLTIVFL